MKRPLIAIVFGLLLAAGFCLGLARLFTLRYEAGEVYPPYSTLRADPVGAKAIHDAFRELPGFEVRRNFLPLKKLQPGQPVTLVYAGVTHAGIWTDREVQELETLLANGSRVVFAFQPFDIAPASPEMRRALDQERAKKRAERDKDKEDDEETPAEEKKEKPKPDADDDESEPGLMTFAALAKRFGFRFDFEAAEPGKAYDRHAFLFAAGSEMETDISWHSALFFADISPDWKPLYLRDNKPVMAERAYGRGSILIASDSFFLSNEALRRERHPRLLSRVFSGPPHIVFDEEHLGVSEQPGIATLVKRYRLHGFVAGLLLVGALFVWKNATRFLPALSEGGDDGDHVLGRDSGQGFTNLLRRSIKPADILRVCVEEWRRGEVHPAKATALVEELWAQEQARPARQRNAAAAYRAIATVLSRSIRRER